MKLIVRIFKEVKMILIMNVDRNFSIGYKGDMLYHLKTDLKRFRDITTGHIMVMGRKTLESLPGAKPLPNRTHIVVTSNKNYKNEDAIIVNDIEKLDDVIKDIQEAGQEVFLIGGANLIDQLLDKCRLAYITKTDKAYELFDTQMANLDKLDNWKIIEVSEIHEEIQAGELFQFKYVTYRNTNFCMSEENA